MINVAPVIENGKLVGLVRGGQVYRFIRVERRWSDKLGTEKEFQFYSTKCWECSEPMEIFLAVGSAKFEVSRRCSGCANPGVAAVAKPDRIKRSKALDGA